MARVARPVPGSGARAGLHVLRRSVSAAMGSLRNVNYHASRQPLADTATRATIHPAFSRRAASCAIHSFRGAPVRRLLAGFVVLLSLAAPAAADELLVAVKRAQVFKSTTDATVITHIEIGQVVTVIYCNGVTCKLKTPHPGSVVARNKFEPFTGVALPCVQLNGKRC